MHRPERHVHTNDHEPEVPRAESLVEHFAEHLRPPIIKAGEQSEDGPAKEHVMKVGNDVISVSLLGIAWCHRVSHARQAANGEQHDEPHREFHCSAKHQLATPHGERPVDDLDTRWDRDGHCCYREHRHRHRTKA